jgi:hypothetical protein
MLHLRSRACLGVWKKSLFRTQLGIRQCLILILSTFSVHDFSRLRRSKTSFSFLQKRKKTVRAPQVRERWESNTVLVMKKNTKKEWKNPVESWVDVPDTVNEMLDAFENIYRTK